MGPGDLDGQRSHVDLASAGGHFHPPHRTLVQQQAPHPNTLPHSHLQASTHLSAPLGHAPPGSSQPGPSRTLPPPHSTTSPPGSADLRHQQPHATGAVYPSRSYSVDSGSKRPGPVPAPAGRDGHLTAAVGHQQQNTMAHHPSHGSVYVDQHLPPNGVAHHGHHAVALVPHPEQYQHASSTPVPMHHQGYAPQYGGGPAQYTQQPQYEGSQFRSHSSNKKPVRAVQACQQCRQRKQKCDEGRPRCGFCDKENLPCEYKETQPPKQDRTILEILNGIREIQREVQELKRDRYQSDAARYPKRRRPNDEGDRPLSSSAGSAEYGGPMEEDSEDTETALQSASSDNAAAKTNATQPPFSSYQHPQQMHDAITAQIMGEELPGAGGIPADHRTSVTHLATWPGIKELYAAAGFPNRKSITQYEEDQGDLRVCGVGQTGDRLEERRPDYTAESPASDNSDPVEPEGLWGPNQLDGPLRLDESTIRRLSESYFKHFHILHPFLDRARLKRMLDTFVNRYRPEPSASATSPFAVPTLPSDAHQHSGAKRPGGSHLGTPHSESPMATPDYGRDVPMPTRQIEKNVTSAIVLLVMALGKIAEHKEYLRGPAKPNETIAVGHNHPSPQGAPSPSNSVKPSPATSHATISSTQSPSISELRSEHSSRQPLADGLASKRQLRNIDVFPGLAYYATATNILDYYVRTKNVPGESIGQHLHLIWAFLLAGLYMGQLCRPKESFTWIEEACKAWIRLVEKFRNLALRAQPSPNKDVDLVKFAYWTCLQLESDIRAELDYEATGIGQYEEEVSFPNGVTDDLVRHDIQPSANPDIICYCLQSYLRKTLNRTHTFIYGSEQQPIWNSQNRSRMYGGPKEMLAELDGFRHLVGKMSQAPADLRNWRDGTDPSADVNVARVYGKYYGARYVILRPFLQHAMHELAAQPVELEERRDLMDSTELPLIKLSQDGADKQSDPAYAKRVIGAALMCVEAAMHSTIAFDGLGTRRRFILTNIHGTALAQFGNMIVLCAAYLSWLGPSGANLIPRRRLHGLLDRTITLMTNLAPLSKVMSDNEIILRVARQKIEAMPDPNGEWSGAGLKDVRSASSSFGS